MRKYSKYIPWILSVLGGLLALYLGTQPPDMVRVPVPVHDTTTIERLVVREGQARLVYVHQNNPPPQIGPTTAPARSIH